MASVQDYLLVIVIELGFIVGVIATLAIRGFSRRD